MAITTNPNDRPLPPKANRNEPQSDPKSSANVNQKDDYKDNNMGSGGQPMIQPITEQP